MARKPSVEAVLDEYKADEQAQTALRTYADAVAETDGYLLGPGRWLANTPQALIERFEAAFSARAAQNTAWGARVSRANHFAWVCVSGDYERQVIRQAVCAVRDRRESERLARYAAALAQRQAGVA